MASSAAQSAASPTVEATQRRLRDMSDLPGSVTDAQTQTACRPHFFRDPRESGRPPRCSRGRARPGVAGGPLESVVGDFLPTVLADDEMGAPRELLVLRDRGCLA